MPLRKTPRTLINTTYHSQAIQSGWWGEKWLEMSHIVIHWWSWLESQSQHPSLTSRQTVLKNIYQGSHTLPKGKPGCFKTSSVSHKGHRWGTVFAKPASSHKEHLMNKILSSLLEDDCCPPLPSLQPVCIIPQVAWPRGREMDTHLLSFWHFSWAGDTSFLDSSQDQLHLFATLIVLEEQNPSEELNDILSDTWTEHQFIAQETILLWWNMIIISSLENISVGLYFLFPQARVVNFYSLFWEMFFPQDT